MAYVLPSGLLNRRITIQKLSGRMSGGQLADEWDDVFQGWAQVNPKNSRALTPSSEGVARTVDTFVFRIRFRKGVTSGMRVNYCGNTYDIIDVIQDLSSRVYLDIVATIGGAK